MPAGDTEYLLRLVQQALDEFEERAVSATARRTARIASLLAESELAVWLGLELKPLGGHPPANAEDTRRLMDDPSTWANPDGPHERAMATYIDNRTIRTGNEQGRVLGFGLGQIEQWLDLDDVEMHAQGDWFEGVLHMRQIVERVRHTCFAALCSWERRLSYANVNERIFERFRGEVDAKLAAGAPEVLDQFASVYRRIREATTDPEASEALAQAVTTCRRILKAIADHLLPGVPGAVSDSGNPLDDSAYRNRIFELVKRAVSGDRMGEMVKAQVGGLIERFNATDGLASKGVHATIGREEAEICAISTYVLAGELLRLAEPSG